VSDKLGTKDVSDQSGEVGGDGVHTFLEVFSQALTEIDQFNDSFRPFLDL